MRDESHVSDQGTLADLNENGSVHPGVNGSAWAGTAAREAVAAKVGVVLVARLATTAAGVLEAKITSTLR